MDQCCLFRVAMSLILLLCMLAEPLTGMTDSAPLLEECLQVVRQIGDELEERNSESCDLVQILTLLRQAAKLAAVCQAIVASTAGDESMHYPASGTPTSSHNPMGIPLAEEGMDTGGSPVGSQSPLDVTQEQVTSVPVRALRTRSRRPPSPPTTRARQPRTAPRSAGGSQRAYVVQQHYIHRQDSPWGICSLEEVPKRIPTHSLDMVWGKILPNQCR